MRCIVVEHINAPYAKVFDLFTAMIAARAGGGKLGGELPNVQLGSPLKVRLALGKRVVQYQGQITTHTRPSLLALHLHNQAQSIAIELRFQATEADEAGAKVSCYYALDLAGHYKILTSRLIRRRIEGRLRHLVRQVKALAESSSLVAPPPPMRRGLWSAPQKQYKGLPEWTAPGVHEVAMALLTKYVTKEASVVDLAAGSGAWLTRLHDAGFRDLSAVELNVRSFGFNGINPRPVDLNTSFSEVFDSSFELVTALEIIEHLDCPRYFLRQIHRLLSDDGHLLLTTPNLGTWRGRLHFLLRAEHTLFGERDYYNQRHISPITDLHMRLMFREIGFRLIESITAGSFDGPIRRLAASPFSLLFRLLLGPRARGDVNVYLVTKDEPETTSFERTQAFLDALGNNES